MTTLKCPKCGNKNLFTGHQVVRMDVTVNSSGDWEEDFYPNNPTAAIYDTEQPYGPWTCRICGESFDE